MQVELLAEMQPMNLSEILTHCIQNQLPFYSYRMPQSDELHTGIQTSNVVESYQGLEVKSDGFVVAPFDHESDSPSYFIRGDIQFSDNDISESQWAAIKSISFTSNKQSNRSSELSKADYLQQAESLIDELKQHKLKKVVLSRTICDERFNIGHSVSIFEKLVQVYPHAFVSFFYIPGRFAWIGASPETLIKWHNESIETMSLAGTKSLNEKSEWTEKERDEQQMVSDYIESTLQSFPFNQIEKEGPMDLIAGTVTHLMTKYRCQGNLSNTEFNHLIEKLHPTPAVCGLPKTESMKLIRKTELHDREYYAGYLGPISPEGCDLFVNLRCMKLTDDGITLYVGGGITALSVAENEWQETCLKAETLLKIIKN